MNTRTIEYRIPGQLATALVIGAIVATSFGIPSAMGAEAKKDPPGFVDKMKQWQDKMSDKFRETWEGWRGKDEKQSIGVASIDLREQQDKYTLRLNLPDRDLDNVDIRFEGGTLHIVAPAEKKVARYEQKVALANVAADVKVDIDRRQEENLIVVTISKAPGVAATTPSPTLPDPLLPPIDEPYRDIFSRMEKMRREMDCVFSESFKEFQQMPEYKGFFDQPRFGSSLDLQEEGENYVVRAYLPDRNMNNVNVTVEGQLLKIEAKAEDVENKSDKEAVKSHKTQFTQVITLPGPVKAEKMKVDKKDGMLVVTLPKS